jgi:nucleoside-diphosphate-sugar epimerase
MGMSNTRTIFVAGASRGVGREIATILVSQGYAVVALLRTADARIELESLGAKVAIGDALNYTDVAQAMTTHSPITAIISTIGGMPVDGQRADYVGNKHLIDAAKAAGIPRFVLVSSLGAGATKDAIPPQAYQSLAAVLADKERAEQHLVESGLTYTIIRPGGLKSAPATGNGVLTIATNVAGSIHRADVATLVCGCLNGTSANNLILSAFDRQMTYGEIEYEEFVPS